MNSIRSTSEIIAMRKSGKILAEVLVELQAVIRAGVTTKQLDELAVDLTHKKGAKPAFLGHEGFPAGLCISVNNEIVHGIPTDRVICEGDIVGLDYGVIFDGMITDSAVTVAVGKVSAQVQNLLNGTQRALSVAINTVRDGVKTGEIGDAVEQVFEQYNLKVIYNLAGHGVGKKVHEDPIIPNHRIAGGGTVLHAGQTIALEPIASIGTHEMYVGEDGWTCKTADGSLSAQFEHTILVTKSGSEVLTIT